MLYKFLYISFMFGIHNMTAVDMYWSTDPLLRVPQVADVMGKSRFQKLNQYFHTKDNQKAKAKEDPDYDPLFKVRRLLKLVTKQSRALYNPGQDISVDEAMIKFNGRLSFKQYVKDRPNPWGIKVWCACDPRTGYLLKFDVYLGRIRDPMPHRVGHHVVTKVASRFLEKGHHMNYNNYFSSVKLTKDLKAQKTYSCVTIHANRQGWPADLGKLAEKNMKKGEVKYRQDGNLLATVWKDKRVVCLLSTNSDAGMQKVKRKAPGGTKEVDIPKPVVTYSSSMGGVDLMDQHHAYYPVGRPSVNWWRYLCCLFQTAMINSFIVYKESQKKKGDIRILTHLQFELEVMRGLSTSHSVKKRISRPSISMEGVVASDPMSHTISHYPGNKQSCVICKQFFFFFFIFFCVPQLYLWASPFLGEIFAYVTVFNLTIKVVTFRLRGWCVLGVFLLPAFSRLGHERQDLLSPCDEMHVCTD